MVYVLFTITITIISHHHDSLILTVIPKPVRRFRLPSPPAGKNRMIPVLITRYISQLSFPCTSPILLSTLSYKKTIPNHAALLHNLLLQRRRRNRKNSPRNSRLGDYCDWILSTTAATYAYAYAYAYAGTYAGARTDRNVDEIKGRIGFRYVNKSLSPPSPSPVVGRSML